MLRSLHIRNYILIDSLDVVFPEGLIIITGQTGAGKSILMGALSFLSGARADAGMIAPGADSCVVEAEFLSEDETLSELLDSSDIENGGGRLTVRRVVSASGRSRSFVNDSPVQLSLLQQISSRLVDIHSQHKSLLLVDRGFQLSVLDAFAGNADMLSGCRRQWKELSRLRSELGELRERLLRLRAERDYDAEQLARLNGARLENGELESLEEEQKSLANAEEIKTALQHALGLISSDGENMGVSGSLKEVCRRLEQISRYLPAMESLVSRLESARIEIDDVAADLETADARMDVSPERLAQVEERMSLLYSLLRKHNCSTVGELIELRDAYGRKLEGSDSLEDRIAELEAGERALAAEWQKSCMELHEARLKAAPELADEISSSLRFLELQNAVFQVRLEEVPGGADGIDRAVFLFSSAGNAPMELSKVASGGEISRIMLSLKAMMAKTAGMPTLVFDEIDTGVSGSVADKMGRMICAMGEDMQVFSITHLPQVAAKGDAHYVVSKSRSEDGRELSTVHRVEGEERVCEIARLLSGSELSDAAIANARVLLGEGR